MKYITIFFAMVLVSLNATAQNKLPEMTVKMADGSKSSLYGCLTGEKATLFVFWKTCCPNNITMIDELCEVYDGESGIDIVLVSLDDQRSSSRVSAVASTNMWDFPIILDKNMDLARAANAIVPPMWILYDSTGSEIYRCKINAGITDTRLQLDSINHII